MKKNNDEFNMFGPTLGEQHKALALTFCGDVPEGVEITPDNLDPEYVSIKCAPQEYPQHSDHPVGELYPLVATVDTTCADFTLFVRDSFIGGVTTDKKVVKIVCNKMLPWYQQAIDKYLLPDGWALSKDWLFATPSGNSFPYINGMKIDLENECIESLVVKDGRKSRPVTDREEIDNIAIKTVSRFKKARARINLYVQHVGLAIDNNEKPSGSVPSTVADTEEMMYDMRVANGLVESARRVAFPTMKNSDFGSVEDKQALVAWCCTNLQVPMIIFNRSGMPTLPN